MNLGKLYGVGIGPGDPNLLTLRGADILRSADVIFTVISKNSTDSVSQKLVQSLQPRGEIRLQIFSMSQNEAERKAVVHANAMAIVDELKSGKTCACATLGDAMTYSTFGYVLPIVQENLPSLDVEIIPGVTSFATLAAKTGQVLVENGQQLRVIPSFTKDMVKSLTFPKGSTTVLLKTYRHRGLLLERLAQEKDIDILYGEHLTMDSQVCLTTLDDIAKQPETYLSLMMVKKS